MNLKHLTDKSLLSDTKNLVTKERESSTAILYHLKEIERRRLFSDLGYSSLYEYAIKELKYTGGAATRRIQSARLLAVMPEIKDKIVKGDLSLSNLSQAAYLFKNENIKDAQVRSTIISKIEKKSTRECEQILLGFAKEPLRPREDIKPVSPENYSMSIVISQKTLDKLNEVKNLLGHRSLTNDELLNLILTTSLIEFKRERFKVGSSATPAPGSQGSTRYINAFTKDQIFQRDLGKCQKCGGTFKLEFDHLLPFALGGKTNKENLRLLCFSCNQRSRIRASL